jgi:Ser/Thr protein kinase RdoA (MazF antagonist)
VVPQLNTPPTLTPFSSLTPEHLLDALDSIGVRGDGRLLALNSYENRVYLVYTDDSSLVVKFYRPGRWTDAQIQEEHDFTQQLHDAEVPAVPPMRINGASLHHFEDLRFAVFPRQGGRSPENEDLASLEWIGRFLGRLHLVGKRTAFQHRPALTIEQLGELPRQQLFLLGSVQALDETVARAYFSVLDQALDLTRERIRVLGGPAGLAAWGWQRIHGDCHLGNILWTEPRSSTGGPHFVDLDDARMGPPVQDLWMLLSGDVNNNREQAEQQLGALVRGYEQFCEFDDACLGAIEALRTLRLIHYSAWVAQRWSDPAFPAAFPWFNTARYWQDRVLELREQIAAMQEPPLRLA